MFNSCKNTLVYSLIFLAIGGVGFLATGEASVEQECLTKTTREQTIDDAENDTLEPQECERWNHLTPITKNNPDLVWKDNQVLMVTWTNSCDRLKTPGALACQETNELYSVGQNEDYALWVTAVPEIRSFIIREAYRPDFAAINLSSRVRQYLGLKPQSNYERFVEIWVDKEDLIRPCLDEDPGDTQCNYWDSDLIGGNSEFQRAVKSSWPFTGFGYTYDWGNPNTDVGASEFVVKDNSTVVIYQNKSTEEYFQDLIGD